jgi:hypothetical protein
MKTYNILEKLKSILSRHKMENVSTSAESLPKLAIDAGNFWSKSHNDEGTQDLSHWVGKGRWIDKNSWEDIGNKHFKMFEDICLLTGKKPKKSMLEWGPGGGANAVRFSMFFDEYFGVDISNANLAECKHQLQIRSFGKFHSILIKPDKPEDCLQSISEPIEFFLSTAVYQHFPGKEYGVLVTETAYKLLVSGGFAIIQIRYDDGEVAFQSKDRDYNINAITFTSYRIEEFWGIAILCGFKPLMVNLEPDSNYAYYLLQKGE